MHSNLVDAIAAKAVIKRATKPQAALTYLTNNTPSAIIVTDPAIVRPKPALKVMNEKIIEYVRNGGTAILATHFGSFVRPRDLDLWFRVSWHLPWRIGDYHRTTVYLNSECRFNRAGLPEEYSQKATFLKNVPKDAAVYLPSRSSTVESNVVPPDPVDCEQTPVVCARIGEGWLGYVGDVNNEVWSQEVILAMCGL